MAHIDISFSFVVSQEMISDVYVLGIRVVHKIVCKFYCTLIVIQKWDYIKMTSEITKDFASSKVVGHKGC
jgi:hypothetical protein